MADLVMRKRKARAGEVGLFIDSEVFQEQFDSIKLDRDLKVTAVGTKSAAQLRYWWALAGKVAENCSWIDDKDAASAMMQIHAKHFIARVDHLRDRTDIIEKGISDLHGDEFTRLINRAKHVVLTEFIPQMPENDLTQEILAMIGATGDFS